MLRADGFQLVVHQDHYGSRQNVPDPEIIAECAKQGWCLLTGDPTMLTQWEQEIRAAGIAVFSQSNNHEGPAHWGPRICAKHNLIRRAADRRARPFAMIITPGGGHKYLNF